MRPAQEALRGLVGMTHEGLFSPHEITTAPMNALFKSIIASLLLLLIFGTVTSLVSGPSFMISQFLEFWPYLLTLVIGFGIQVFLFLMLKARHHPASRALVATTGSSSTIAMISCCSHYLVTFLPFLGATGIATVVAQYQTEIFFIGILMNFIGIAILLNKFFNPSV
jgi:Cu+-exporting ATPase